MKRTGIKRIIALAMTCAMLLSACGKGGQNTADEGASGTETPTGTTVDMTPPSDAEILQTAASYDTGAADWSLSIDAADKVHDISGLLYGIFFEDINFAADGGLYAEMVKNRSFEFNAIAANDQLHGWSKVGNAEIEVIRNDAESYLNENNPNYLLVKNNGGAPAGVSNHGFLDGMSVNAGAEYDFSVYARGIEGYKGAVHVSIYDGNELLCTSDIGSISSDWAKYELTLTPDKSATKAVKLQVTIDDGSAAFDMISLFPKDTYKGRSNGLRADLVEKLAALEPKFLRFPGGCVIEGVSLAKAYDWKDSIGVGRDGQPLKWNGKYGDVTVRKMGQNIWIDERMTEDRYPSFMSYGLGFYEYFLLAEDIGALGVPVLNCGLSCMGQGDGSGPDVGTAEFNAYVQDALDLVEFCRGDASTVWGAVRCDLGHEEPFDIKYIGIGNEQFGVNFFKHYEAFVEAFDKAAKENPEMYGDIELIFSAGLDDGDSGNAGYMASYRRAEKWLNEHSGNVITDFAGAIDQHYYNAPEWFLTHNDYYDEANYSRTADGMTTSRFGGAIPVFVGEFAAQSNTLRAALAEASYMTGLERNGDIVVMAAYAPLFGNSTANHWSPDLIWFNNHSSTASANYYVQQIFSRNAGTTLLGSALSGAEGTAAVFKGSVGVGTWNTAATFDDIKVTDNKTGNVLAEDDFSSGAISDKWTRVSDGLWSVEDGALKQKSNTTNTDKYGSTGSAMYFGDSSWEDYTLTLTAKIDSGSEGFLIPFAVGDMKNNYFWNIGGWNNTVSCLQQVSGGSKSGQLDGTVKRLTLKKGTAYNLKVVVSGSTVKCYIDDVLYIDYDVANEKSYDGYHVVSTDASGDIIVKIVNVSDREHTVAIDVKNAGTIRPYAVTEIVAGSSPADENLLDKEEKVTFTKGYTGNVSDRFNLTVKPYSVTVIRLN